MTKATTKPSTSSPAVNGNGNGRHAELHANIKQLAELWLSIIARETPADTDDPDFNEAMRLEFEIAATPVYTLRGYHAKCAAIARAEWDADDLATICLLMRPRHSTSRRHRNPCVHQRSPWRSVARLDG